jgi:hypothetical protein
VELAYSNEDRTPSALGCKLTIKGYGLDGARRTCHPISEKDSTLQLGGGREAEAISRTSVSWNATVPWNSIATGTSSA